MGITLWVTRRSEGELVFLPFSIFIERLVGGAASARKTTLKVA